MTFYRGVQEYDCEYIIDGVSIERVHIIKDLGILLDEKPNLKAHIVDVIIAKAKSRLERNKRFSREFEDPWTIRRLLYINIANTWVWIANLEPTLLR